MGRSTKKAVDPEAAAAAERKRRRERAERIAREDPDAVLEAALSVDGVRALSAAGTPDPVVGALVRLAGLPEAWRDLPAWDSGPAGVQARPRTGRKGTLRPNYI